MEPYKQAFNKVGWFIPPYVAMGFLAKMAKEIDEKNSNFNQETLEQLLALIYSPENLAAMVLERYPITPYIQDYKNIISESISAHFYGLNYAAVATLLPVIEGAGRKLAKSRSVPVKSIRSVFINLADDCKNDAILNSKGEVGEIISMMDSFIEFTKNHLYIESSDYALKDKTNRHGILHGAYCDEDYGKPINFYKIIAAVDFLCFISAFQASISWFAPEPTFSSKRLSAYYTACLHMKGQAVYFHPITN